MKLFIPTITNAKWNGNGIFHRPPATQPTIQHGTSDAKTVGPACKRERLAVVGDIAVLASIAPLYFVARPSAVFGRIWAIIVDAIQRHPLWSVWAWTHVVIEVLERLSPAIAYVNSTSTVVFIQGAFGVIATSKHRAPSSVFKGERESVSAFDFSLETPARLRSSVAKRATNDVSGNSALALTPPRNFTCGREPNASNDPPATVSPARHIYQIILRSHKAILTENPVFMGIKTQYVTD
jgi:hypothetical protein